MRSFLEVTGEKTDLWLVDTVGLLICAIGASLLLAARKPFPERATVAVAMGAAAGLAFIDIKYVITRIISPIYIGDAIVEIVLLMWWVNVLWRSPIKP
jgi:hypothetical protein